MTFFDPRQASFWILQLPSQVKLHLDPEIKFHFPCIADLITFGPELAWMQVSHGKCNRVMS